MAETRAKGDWVKGKWVPRNNAADAERGVKRSGDDIATSGAGVGERVASEQAARPKLPERSEFATEAEYNTAYEGYKKKRGVGSGSPFGAPAKNSAGSQGDALKGARPTATPRPRPRSGSGY